MQVCHDISVRVSEDKQLIKHQTSDRLLFLSNDLARASSVHFKIAKQASGGQVEHMVPTSSLIKTHSDC